MLPSTWVRVFSGQKTRFSSGMKTLERTVQTPKINRLLGAVHFDQICDLMQCSDLAPATAAPRTVMTVSRCSTLRTSSSQTVSRRRTASTEPQMKAMFLAITVARGLGRGGQGGRKAWRCLNSF